MLIEGREARGGPVPEVDRDRARTFIEGCYRRYAIRFARIMRARGWQEADAKDIVHEAFKSIIRGDDKDLAASFARMITEIDYDPSHLRAREWLHSVVKLREIDFLRRKPDNPSETLPDDASEEEGHTYPMELRIEPLAEQGLLETQDAERRRLLFRRIEIWLKLGCRRFRYDGQWQVYRGKVVDELSNADLAQKVGLSEKRVANLYTEVCTIHRAIGRLLLAFDDLPRAPTPDERMKRLQDLMQRELERGDFFGAPLLKQTCEDYRDGKIFARIASDHSIRLQNPNSTDERRTVGRLLSLLQFVTLHYEGADAHDQE